MFADAIGPQIQDIERPEPKVERLAGQRLAKDAGKGIGHQGDDFGAPRRFDMHRFGHQIARLQTGADRDAAMRFGGRLGIGFGGGFITHARFYRETRRGARVKDGAARGGPKHETCDGKSGNGLAGTI